MGKTGKEGLKRRCLECEPYKLNPDAAKRTKELFGNIDLDDVRDVSAGAATFYVWVILSHVFIIVHTSILLQFCSFLSRNGAILVPVSI